MIRCALFRAMRPPFRAVPPRLDLSLVKGGNRVAGSERSDGPGTHAHRRRRRVSVVVVSTVALTMPQTGASFWPPRAKSRPACRR
jgi:hypothetical protein